MGSLARTRVHDHRWDEQGFLRVPTLVQWMATLRCPLSCPHCLSAGSAMPDMPLGKVCALIDEVAELGVDEFLITGGEPLAREDLPAVIEHLGRRGVSYSLNTAVSPSPRLRRALRRWSPVFVAVSVDGPASCHDHFRGRSGALAAALEAITFFSGLCPVAAGTTVTTANVGTLEETFHLVTHSGVSAWGLHLPVAEGRARKRPDLFLSKTQLRRLLAFTARKRNHFPVAMADELGYCGDFEPLVRDQPLRCGAGRSQCVVLPDGEVVPCTTLDRRQSAGNLHERSLLDIWTHGFAKLRAWEPAGKCKACAYARACQGGCWLQRRGGMPCYREVWHVPEALRSAAGIALCLGALAMPGQAAGRAARPARHSPLDCASPAWACQPSGREEVPSAVERWGYCLLADEINSGRAPLISASKRPKPSVDAAEHFYVALRSGALDRSLSDRAKAVSAALGTQTRSLSLIAVLWRTLAEPCLDSPSSAQRPPALRRELRAALAGLERKALSWRREIFARKLDPYLARSGVGRGPVCKAAFRMPAWLALARDTQQERWGEGKDAALDGFLARHPYPDGLDLVVAELGGGAKLVTAAGEPKAGSMGVFDVIVTDIAPGVLVLKDRTAARRIALPASAELTYADVLRLAYDQHGAALDKLARALVARGNRAPLKGHIQPLLLQPMRTLAQARGDAARAARWWLADFWMF
jgi:radical SAM protein with 4Fe4S-binding SPASM domain